MDRFRYDLIPAGTAVLCALSGGADSMYLLCRLLEGAEAGGYTVSAAHLNHSLRPTAGRDETFVRQWCGERGVPLSVGRCDVAGQARARGQGLEETARELRYAFLAGAAADMGCALIATGHHAGDNAETVLLNLLRGCGLKGLTGIPERRGNIIRPMLWVERGEIDRYLAAHGLPHVEDETNGDLTIQRNRVRRQLLPLLEELNPQAVRHIVQTAARLGQDEAELSRRAEELLEQCTCRGESCSIPAAALVQAPRPVALRAAAALMAREGLGRQAVHLEGVLELAKSGGASARLDVPGGTVRREYGKVVFEHGGKPPPLPEVPLSPGEHHWGEWRIVCTPAVCPDAPGTPESFYLKEGCYTIRPRRTGDGLRPPNRVYKTVKKWLMDQKVPSVQRERVPVLALDGRAAAAGGIGVDGDFVAAPGEPCLHIIWVKEREL